MKENGWIRNYMRQGWILYCLFLGLINVYPRDFTPLGSRISIPGSFGGIATVFPSFPFSADPRASSVNPASMADRELPIFGFSIVPAFSIDQPAGSSLYASGYASTLTPLGTATLLFDGGDPGFGFYGASSFLGISKRNSKNLAFGMGLGAAFLSADEDVYGFNASFGVQMTFPELGTGGSDLAVSMLALGTSLSPLASSNPIIAPTPLIVFSSRLIESRYFSLSMSGITGMPNLDNVFAGIGISFGFGQFVDMDLGWSWTFPNMRLPTTQDSVQLIPSISVKIDASSFLKYSSYGASVTISSLNHDHEKLSFETGIAFSKGQIDNFGPEIDVGPLMTDTFSALLTSSIIIPIAIHDSSRIIAWNFNVYDSGGVNVFTTSDGLETDSGSTELFSIKRSVKLPPAIKLPLSQKFANGMYRVRTWAMDERGNESRADEKSFQIDSTPPDAKVEIEGKSYFSPNGDGIQDLLKIVQIGSVENIWLGTIRDAIGQRVRSFQWTDGPPTSFSWDGKNDDGEKVPDGTFSYTLESTDAALNQTNVKLSSILMDSRLSIVKMSMNSRVLRALNDNSFQPLMVNIDVPIKEGLLEWKIELRAADDSIFHTWSGSRERLDVLPSTIMFDGRNSDGERIPDGSYRFHAQLKYLNGNAPSTETDSFIVDTIKPEGRIRANSTLFSPDNGSSIVLYHDLSPNSDWVGTINDAKGVPVITYPLGKNTEPICEWYGLNADGDPVEDGTYLYTAIGTSPSGIVGSTSSIEIRIESSGAQLALIADKKTFSARVGNSGIRFIPRLEKRERIISYELNIRTIPEKALIRAFEGFGLPPGSILWDGYDTSGVKSNDGMYSAELTLRSDSGLEIRSAPIVVQLDSTIPQATVQLSSKIFSPNKDGKLDTIDIRQTAERETLWEGYILNEHDLIAKAYSWNGIPPASISWDGRDEKGAIFPDGLYRYRLYSMDSAGNQGVYETPAFKLDSRIPMAFIQIDKTIFSPNGDSFADFINIRISPSFIDGLVAWELSILDFSNQPIRVLETSGNLLTGKRWDGRSKDSIIAGDGIYKARIALRYEKGDHVSFDSNPFRIDTTPPKVSLKLAPLPFSPDEDNENDELLISLQASDDSAISSWIMTILDPEGHPFTVFAGSTLPEEPIYWDGRDLDGNLVEAAQEYSYDLSVRDVLGNTSRSSGTIPIDVFVLRDGERLKIRISSIVFAPNTAEMLTADIENSKKNSAVLDRIAVVLAKFPSYRIRVEGHAVNISGTEREERNELEPLSLARAQAVSDALVVRGVPRTRLESKGLGGREPLVPHGDSQNRWRNRRVEFILVR